MSHTDSLASRPAVGALRPTFGRRGLLASVVLTVAVAVLSGSVAMAGSANSAITVAARFQLRTAPLAAAPAKATATSVAAPVARTQSTNLAKPARVSATTLSPLPPAEVPGDMRGTWLTQPIRLPAAPLTATAGSGANFGTTEATAAKAVVIVGPSGAADTAANLAEAEDFAASAESYGMDVRRVFFPHATWQNLLANIEGASLVVYFGHGNGWPSPYPPFQEHSKDGFGLDSRDGGGPNDVTYYGADYIRRSVTLASNAVVVLSHLCYSAGNGEPGMPIPDLGMAAQRVDNTASGFLAVGARAVFAYATGSIKPILDGLFGAGDQTIDRIFMSGGKHSRPYYGFVGWNDQYVDSVRTPGDRSHLDPGRDEGFLRAVTGDLSMTASDWRAAGG